MLTSRMNDYKKRKTTSLIKQSSLFKETKANVFGGRTDTGVKAYMKKGKKRFKLFYSCNHELTEYFANEIILRLGIYTPKCRLASDVLKNYLSGVEGYIPMLAIRHELKLRGNVQNLLPLREQYKLDIQKQVVIDLKHPGKEYKISGNLFSTDIAAELVMDGDFGPDYLNLGLKRCGNRFFTVMIDKDQALFLGYDYEQLQHYFKTNYSKAPSEDALYASRTRDQQFAIIHEINSALTEENGICDFDRIFNNERVKNTPILGAAFADSARDLKFTARSILEKYMGGPHDKSYLHFLQREHQRELIAEEVIKLFIIRDSDVKDIKKIIIEDLRAPYYKQYFANRCDIQTVDVSNEILIHAIAKDLQEEMNLTPRTALRLA